MTSKMLYGAENMKKFSIKQISLIAGILATVSFILRIISLLSFHEYSGYYQKDAIVPIISNTVFAISIIFALVATMVFVKKDHSIPLPSNISNYCAIIPIATAIFHISRILTLPYNDLAVNKYLMIITCVLFAAYFLMIFINKEKETVRKGGIGRGKTKLEGLAVYSAGNAVSGHFYGLSFGGCVHLFF